MFEIILCFCTPWSHTKRFHTHTGHPPRERLSLPPPELPGSSAPLVQHLMVQRPITLLNTGNDTNCTGPLLPVPRLALTPVPLMRLPQQLRWSNNLWYMKAHICCFGATINSKRMRRYYAICLLLNNGNTVVLRCCQETKHRGRENELKNHHFSCVIWRAR